MIGTKFSPEKTVWQKHGKTFLIFLLLVAITYGGVQYYQYYQTEQAVQASRLYDNMLSLIQKKEYDKAKAEAETLKKQYAKTVYAPLGLLLLAKLEFDQNNVEAAASHLRLAMETDKKGPVHQIARVRLARLLADRKEYTEALALLTPEKVPTDYVTLFEETKGDVYLMQNEMDKAREAYLAAMEAAPPGTPLVRLQLKQTDLGSKMSKIDANQKVDTSQ